MAYLAQFSIQRDYNSSRYNLFVSVSLYYTIKKVTLQTLNCRLTKKSKIFLWDFFVTAQKLGRWGLRANPQLLEARDLEKKRSRQGGSGGKRQRQAERLEVFNFLKEHILGSGIFRT